MLPYINILPKSQQAAFSDKVMLISDKLDINPAWLMQVMKNESGINPSAQNIQDGHTVAAGLIQFTSATAKGLGTSIQSLLSMSAASQLDYVLKYYLPFKKYLKSYPDMYLATFFPAAMGKPDTWVFQSSSLSAALIARQNAGIDLNKDGQITVGEFRKYVNNIVPSALKGIMFGSSYTGLLVLSIVTIISYLIIK